MADERDEEKRPREGERGLRLPIGGDGGGGPWCVGRAHVDVKKKNGFEIKTDEVGVV